MVFDPSSPLLSRIYRYPVSSEPSRVVHLEHIEMPFEWPDDRPLGSPPHDERADQRDDQPNERPNEERKLELAQAYWDRVAASIFEIPSPTALDLTLPTPLPKALQPVPEGLKYRVADIKSLHEFTVLTLAQTHFGIEVWQSGFSIVMRDYAPLGPQQITSSQCTFYLHESLRKKPRFSLDSNLKVYSTFAYMPERLDKTKLAEVLGLPDTKPIVSIEDKQLVIYLFDRSRRLEGDDPEGATGDYSLEGTVPTLTTLPKIDPRHEVEDGEHYVVTEVLFTTQGIAGRERLSWRAFVEVQHGGVLYLRPLVSSCFDTVFPPPTQLNTGANDTLGSVFKVDPVTQLGGAALTIPTPPSSPTSQLDGMRAKLNLLGLPLPVNGSKQRLEGEYVAISNEVEAPKTLPPQQNWQPELTRDGTNAPDFTFSVADGQIEQNSFTNVSAYFHCDTMFRMVEQFGFTKDEIMNQFLPSVTFPIIVDPQGTDQRLKAEVYMEGDAVSRAVFGTVQTSDISDNIERLPIGNAADVRIVLHEFCHILLGGSTGDLNFEFAHSAGDSLAAILCDPGSQAPDPAVTFPWTMALNPGTGPDKVRFHEGTAANGRAPGGQLDLNAWGWYGDIYDMDAPPSTNNEYVGYLREQILSMTLFRVYKALGGAKTGDLERQRFAARYVAYLIIQAIYLCSPDRNVPADKPEVFDTRLREADAETGLFPNDKRPDHKWPVPKGLTRKVMRWGFEKQGLYKSNPPSADGMGAPPPVDIYIDDGRNGEYEFTEDFSTTEIWNRRSKYAGNETLENFDPIAQDEDAILDQPNFIYVRVRNRGARQATSVTLRAFSHPGSDLNSLSWDNSWTEMSSDPQMTASFSVNAGGFTVKGPFEWTPTGTPGDASRDMCVLVSASASAAKEDLRASEAKEDLSNIDKIQANDSVPLWWLVPADNNIGARIVIVNV